MKPMTDQKLNHPYFDGKLTLEEQNQLINLMNKAITPNAKQKEEFVEFFKGLIPILIDASIDLESKGLCPEDCKGMAKYRRLFKT